MVVPTARDLMTESPVCVNEADTVVAAAELMQALDVGALPICGEDNRLHGMLTDRDIVLKVVAKGLDPSKINVGQLAQGQIVTVEPDDSAEQVVATMAAHQLRRMPVIDDHVLVGMIAQSDVARVVGDSQTGELVAAVSAD
jgi:CBS domain-containing protein